MPPKTQSQTMLLTSNKKEVSHLHLVLISLQTIIAAQEFTSFC